MKPTCAQLGQWCTLNLLLAQLPESSGCSIEELILPLLCKLVIGVRGCRLATVGKACSAF
jgi:hypothetical protein